MFTKEERSGFKYWFAHWCAFQMTALNHKCWRAKYLFHDIEKPWLKLIWSYPKVQKWHREHNSHHLEYFYLHYKADFLAMIIDWECSRFTKEASPRTAREEYTKVREEVPLWIKGVLDRYLLPLLNKYNFK